VLARTQQWRRVDGHRRLCAHGGHIQVVPPVAAPALAVEVEQRQAARGRLQGVGHEVHDCARVHQEKVPGYRRAGRLLIRVPPRVALHAAGGRHTWGGRGNITLLGPVNLEGRSTQGGRPRRQAARRLVEPCKARVARSYRLAGPAWTQASLGTGSLRVNRHCTHAPTQRGVLRAAAARLSGTLCDGKAAIAHGGGQGSCCSSVDFQLRAGTQLSTCS
jgi:hypothetical protein